MKSLKKFLFIFLCGMSALPMTAQEEESPSKQINSIKRNGSYIYVEATESTKETALKSCEELLKVEISKYVAMRDNLSSAEQVIIKDIQFGYQTISMQRGEKTRVFMYVEKNKIEGVKNVTVLPVGSVGTQRDENKVSEPPRPVEPLKIPPSVDIEPAKKTSELHAGNQNLDEWQSDLLKKIIAAGDIKTVKNVLNRSKAQNKVKRIGDNTTVSTRSENTYYAIFNEYDMIIALLAPSNDSRHFDFISGTILDSQIFPSRNYLWFTLSK